MHYFAYGSNMLTPRLERRVGRVRLLGRAKVLGRRLAFHKRSWDGSGKCDIPPAGAAELVHGVVYELPDGALDILDYYEGGYERTKLRVDLSGEAAEVQAYVAEPWFVDGSVRPFDWYLKLVQAGIDQHGLVEEYRSALLQVVERPDPVLDRSDRLEALEILEDFYAALGRDA